MVKSFSVQWLARSHYDIQTEQDTTSVENSRTNFKPHIPCTVQPRPPTCYNKDYLQMKSKASVDDNSKQRTYYSSGPAGCSSPSLSENSGYSSGYESEAASLECPIENDGEKRGTHRRVRTKFTSEQIYKLEKTFNKHKYLDPTERIKTAAKLNLSETQVRTWFQNRRMKLKREVQDWRTENFPPTLLCPTMFPHAPSVQNHSYAGQRLPFTQAPHAIYPPMMQQVPVQQIHPMMLAPHYY
ncbi:homeobox protein vent1B-like [Megalops cyprinoides]|uniref:homeobox protein vent1B-like n=1 Tax=Megalops cyprinoides TaxID=118141 RepID=UPI001864CC16|nr:homeobox protein vent1B-like [Megalops cyprinoides]